MLNQTCTEKQMCAAALRHTIYFFSLIEFSINNAFKEEQTNKNSILSVVFVLQVVAYGKPFQMLTFVRILQVECKIVTTYVCLFLGLTQIGLET